MSNRPSHIIQRQVFDVSAGSSKTDFDWVGRASNYLNSVINPALEKCFDRMNMNDRHIILDKLEIDLGSFTSENFEKEAAARLVDILEKRLKEYSSAPATKKESVYHTIEKGETANRVFRANEVQLMNEAKGRMLALKHFILKGYFPWWFSSSGLHRLADFNQAFHTDWIGSLSFPEIEELKNTLQNSEHARIRLANHFSSEWLAAFLEKIGLAGHKAFEQYQILFSAFQFFPDKITIFHQFFWSEWIRISYHSVYYINVILLIEKISGGDKTISARLAELILQACIEKQDHHPFDNYIKVTGNYLKRLISEGHLTDETVKAVREKDILFTKEEPINELQIDDFDKVNEAAKADEKKENLKEGDVLYTEAAGIVLLNPFLSELFCECGLWENEKWKSNESAFKVVQILSWLAFGETDLPEHRLLILKILAGLDIEALVPAQPSLTDEEKKICSQLLQAVVEHWKALRNTSPDGLREGFLIRNGKLVKTADGYNLIVERLAQDILLSNLPWGYSMIKLPWMNDILRTTWL